MNKENIKIYIVGNDTEYANWIENHTLVDNIGDADLVIFTGGEDVSPSMYNENKHYTTYSNINRDLKEKIDYDLAIANNKYILGICRGSQFLCAMNGGILVQDQPNPSYNHIIKTIDNKEVLVTSTHHQAQYPYLLPKENYKVLGWTENMLSYHKDGDDEELAPLQECEIVYYPKTKCLGIQSHPEMMYPPSNNSEHESIEYMRELLTKFLTDNL